MSFNEGPYWNKRILEEIGIRSSCIDKFFEEKENVYLFHQVRKKSEQFIKRRQELKRNKKKNSHDDDIDDLNYGLNNGDFINFELNHNEI